MRVYLPEPLPHQIEVLRDPARHKVVCCGRRWGKTLLGLIACCEGHGGGEGALAGKAILWCAPTFSIASLIWRALKHGLADVATDKSETERRIVLPGGGSVTIRSGDNPSSLRGAGYDGVVLDECAFMTEEVWSECLRPALSDRQGWSIHISTPCGQNHFHALYEQAATSPGWKRWQRPTSDNPRIPESELAAARAELGTYRYGQEFEAQFLVAGGGLFRPEWFSYFNEDKNVYLYNGGSCHYTDLRRYVTVDLAATVRDTSDYTVIGTFGATQDGRLLLLDMIRERLEGPAIIPRLQHACLRWDVSSAWVEASGYQITLIQAARNEGLPIRELRPDRDKVSRALPATATCEAGRLLFPKGAGWTHDLESELTAFPNGEHDDMVDVIAYGVHVWHECGLDRPPLERGTDPKYPDDDGDGPHPDDLDHPDYNPTRALFEEFRPAPGGSLFEGYK